MGRRKTRNLKAKPKKNQYQIDKLIKEMIEEKEVKQCDETKRESV